MTQDHAFARNELAPSWWANRIQDIISGMTPGVVLKRQTDTTVRADVVTPPGISSAIIQGRWRYITAAVDRAHPGGASGVYDVWAVAEDNNIDNTPDPATDHTNYAWDLRITPTGSNPSGAGVVIFNKIGEVDWSGSLIQAVRQTYGQVSSARLEPGAQVPIGVPLPWPGAENKVPTNFVLADGRALSRSTYAVLFDRYGTTWGAGDGSTTFNIPDLRGRTIVAPDAMGGADAGRLSANQALGNTGGEEKHTLSVAEMPSHSHTTSGSTIVITPTFGRAFPSGSDGFLSSGTDATGGGASHNNMQPYAVLNQIIRVL